METSYPVQIQFSVLRISDLRISSIRFRYPTLRSLQFRSRVFEHSISEGRSLGLGCINLESRTSCNLVVLWLCGPSAFSARLWLFRNLAVRAHRFPDSMAFSWVALSRRDGSLAWGRLTPFKALVGLEHHVHSWTLCTSEVPLQFVVRACECGVRHPGLSPARQHFGIAQGRHSWFCCVGA